MKLSLRYYAAGFIMAAAIAFAAVWVKADEDDWIALLSHGGFVVAALYAYDIDRKDIAVLTILLIATSVIWHTRGSVHEDEKRQLDTFTSLFLAMYSYGTSLLSRGLTAIVTSFYCIIIAFFTGLELEYTLPVAIAYILIVLVLHEEFYLWRVLFVAAVSGLAYYVWSLQNEWHSMWHVLSALTIPLALNLKRPPTVKKLVPTQIDSVVKYRF